MCTLGFQKVQNLHHIPGRNTGKPIQVGHDQMRKHFVPPSGNGELSWVSRQKSSIEGCPTDFFLVWTEPSQASKWGD